jgi:hypothetical protein
METREVKVYRFSELPEWAKEKAIEDSYLSYEYLWADDAMASLFAWAKVISLEITDYSIDWGNPSQWTIKYNDKHVDFDYTFNLDKDLTGYCMDYTLMIPWNKTKDIDECIEDFKQDCVADFEYQTTREHASQHFDANDYYFTEDGRVFNY